MIIYPTLELMGGRCVWLNRGRLEEPRYWDHDPLEVAASWSHSGAEWMHLTDLDAVEGRHDNEALVEKILMAAEIPVQLAGGFRSRERVERWIDKGAGRIVLGTMAVRNPKLAIDLAFAHPDQIVLAVDVWKGQLMTDGWRRAAAVTPADFLADFGNAPFAAVLISDIDSDIEKGDAALGLITGLAARLEVPVIARGTVRGRDDISRLKYVPGISGTLVARALMDGTLSLKEALATARPEREKKAEFI